MAAFQLIQMQLTHRYRGQASSHIFDRCKPDLACKPESRVGAGLPAKAACQSTQMQLTHRHHIRHRPLHAANNCASLTGLHSS